MLKNEVEAGAPLCQAFGADTYTNTDWRKRLSVATGQTAYFSYLPNGHIVKDKKAIGTQHGVYWTGQVGTSLSTTLDMKPENLLDGHTMDYDDGNCGESVDSNGNPGGRAGDGKPCIGSFVVPAGTAPGIYNMDQARGYFDSWICFKMLRFNSDQHPVTAHTWIDCFDTDRSKLYDQSTSYIFGGAGGNGFCQGYGAGYPGRGDIDIGTAYTYKMLKNEVEAGAPLCQAFGADTYTNTDWRKRLSVATGQTAYFSYLPNGHIVKDKKAIGTQHGVYWTGQVGTSLSTTLDMKPENLLDGHTMDYDDGNCGESVDSNGNPGGRAGDGKPCIGSFVVPAGTAPGIYNMVCLLNVF
ncbi:hypothetical protein JM18_004837 [Phytophthora kernoviae]|uniref:Uncharacterized protein n=1 Tax=Phytophthora kernoviae TaxID=325452 RepID=A0A921SGA0_9STRA|nr:hypothetical protein JM18_004837 [Phytophthora kernoviae]